MQTIFISKCAWFHRRLHLAVLTSRDIIKDLFPISVIQVIDGWDFLCMWAKLQHFQCINNRNWRMSVFVLKQVGNFFTNGIKDRCLFCYQSYTINYVLELSLCITAYALTFKLLSLNLLIGKLESERIYWRQYWHCN